MTKSAHRPRRRVKRLIQKPVPRRKTKKSTSLILRSSGFWQAIFTALTFIAAAAGSFYWLLESGDRALARQVARVEVVQRLRADLDQLRSPESFPTAKFSAGFAIQKLGELGEPIIIVGEKIEISDAIVRCAGTVKVLAEELVIRNSTFVGTSIVTSAEKIVLEGDKFIDSKFQTQEFWSPGSDESVVKISGSYFVGQSDIAFATHDFTFDSSFSNSRAWVRSENGKVSNSFFIDHYLGPQGYLDKAKDPPVFRDAELWEIVNSGVYFTAEDLNASYFSIRDSSARTQEGFAKWNGKENIEAAGVAVKIAIDNYCVYGSTREFRNTASCPPLALIESEHLSAIVNRQFGLDHYFINYALFNESHPENGNKPLSGKLKFSPIKSYFENFSVTSLAGAPIVGMKDAPCRKRKALGR